EGGIPAECRPGLPGRGPAGGGGKGLSDDPGQLPGDRFRHRGPGTAVGAYGRPAELTAQAAAGRYSGLVAARPVKRLRSSSGAAFSYELETGLRASGAATDRLGPEAGLLTKGLGGSEQWTHRT